MATIAVPFFLALTRMSLRDFPLLYDLLDLWRFPLAKGYFVLGSSAAVKLLWYLALIVWILSQNARFVLNLSIFLSIPLYKASFWACCVLNVDLKYERTKRIDSFSFSFIFLCQEITIAHLDIQPRCSREGFTCGFAFPRQEFGNTWKSFTNANVLPFDCETMREILLWILKNK